MTTTNQSRLFENKLKKREILEMPWNNMDMDLGHNSSKGGLIIQLINKRPGEIGEGRQELLYLNALKNLN